MLSKLSSFVSTSGLGILSLHSFFGGNTKSNVIIIINQKRKKNYAYPLHFPK